MKLALVGLGIRGTNQLTLEAIEKLKSSRCVLVHASKSIVNSLEQLLPTKIIGIKDLYKNGEVDEKNYKCILDRILEEAKCSPEGSLISVVIAGHPRVGVTLSTWLDSIANDYQLELEVIPGISSFDTMLVDLQRDPLERGSILLDVNRLLLFGYQIDPTLDLYIYHVCSIGTRRTHFLTPEKENKIDLLAKKLSSIYAADHPVTLIGCSEAVGSLPIKVDCNVGSLTELLPKITFSTTLFVPAQTPKRVDRLFLKELQSN